jgi:hypothetical protein
MTVTILVHYHGNTSLSFENFPMRQADPVVCVRPQIIQSTARTALRPIPSLKSILPPIAKGALYGAAIGAGAAVTIGFISLAIADKLDEVALSHTATSLVAAPIHSIENSFMH